MNRSPIRFHPKQSGQYQLDELQCGFRSREYSITDVNTWHYNANSRSNLNTNLTIIAQTPKPPHSHQSSDTAAAVHDIHPHFDPHLDPPQHSLRVGIRMSLTLTLTLNPATISLTSSQITHLRTSARSTRTSTCVFRGVNWSANVRRESHEH